jgi:chitin synthase
MQQTHYDLQNLYDGSNHYTPEVSGSQYPQQFSPIQDHQQVPPIRVNEYGAGPPITPYNDNDFYHNETLSASTFNAFPTDYDNSGSNIPLPPQDASYFGNNPSYSEIPLTAPYQQQGIELQDRYNGSQEEDIGFDHQIDGDNYELNTFAKEVYDEDGSFCDENDANQIPEEQHRRKIEVGLLNGNLILDCPVPDRILEKYTEKHVDDSREFKFMRYQAATCDPRDFLADNFSLRQRYYKRPRECEIMIVITLYNEPDVLLARTLKGVFENIKHLESRKRSSTWGQDAWKKVVVCVVADGRSKINDSAQALLAGLGVYQEGFARNAVNDKKVVSHIYEYSSMIGISSIEKNTVKLKTAPVPTQLLFCLKEENKKKINSHRWALEGFGKILDPKVVVLLDAGTQPSKDSIYHLWKEFDKDPKVAGTCGEIKAMLGSRYEKLLNPLVAAQNFEYKMSNILDKPMESAFGFISVLPGAFSAYRYSALLNQPNGDGPLAKYFEGETLHDQGAGIFKSNMYLAEDRILCFELVAKRNCSWILRYCRSASAETDVPEEVHDFVSQRRRWLNGSFFAAIYSIVHFYKLMSQSSHSFGRKFALCVEFFYQLISLLVSWFSLASFFLVFRILTTSLGDIYTPCKYLSVVFLWLYLLSIVTTFVLSFGNTPRGTPKFYVVIIIFFAILMAYMIAAAIVMSVRAIEDIVSTETITAKVLLQNRTFRDLIISTASTYALYLIASILHLKPMHMITSFLQYLLLSPSYVNVLNIYAFCNLHDISWGTKGATAQSLGDAKITEDGKVEFIDAPITTDEINTLYEKQMDILAHVPKPKPQVTEESIKLDEQKRKEAEDEKNKNYYAFIRSMVVLTWITTNFIIIALVLETGGVNQFSTSNSTSTSTAVDAANSARSEIFLTVILWIVAFMAAFRLIGTVYYLISRMIK